MGLGSSGQPSSSPPESETRREREDQAGLVASQRVIRRPSPIKHVSTPAHESPLRYQHKGQNIRQVKESLNARSEYVTSQDGHGAQHQINQYIIKQEIGRGSFGAVHLATDQYGREYAVKEFSKSRLRKRAQSHVFRKPRRLAKPGQLSADEDFNSPLHRRAMYGSGDDSDAGKSIDLIKEEIAVMKKLNHPHLCALIEVLDDPREDSLYMVMEMCRKGIIMKVSVEHQCDPYSREHCRQWFRHLILGIEYLHAHGIAHRDIKPDNCLLTEDEILKVVDFGVSEMFEKDSQMLTAKSAGSPAFLPPELCVVKHGDVSGTSADIWSMGVTLYCLKYGRLPFEEGAIFDLFGAIKNREPSLKGENDEDFCDLIHRILEKDADKRIRMTELREHPWVTKQGSDPLLSEAENTELADPPTAAEMECAITGNVANLLTVVKAVNKFKRLVAHKRPILSSSDDEEDQASRFVQPPIEMDSDSKEVNLTHKSQSVPLYDRRPVEGALVVDGVHRDMNVQRSTPGRAGHEKAGTSADTATSTPAEEEAGPQGPSNSLNHPDHRLRRPPPAWSADDEDRASYHVFRPTNSFSPKNSGSSEEAAHRAPAHNPLQDHLYLHIGPSNFSGADKDAGGDASLANDDEAELIVSESPGAADVDIYETAYKDEIERIRQRCKEEGADEEPTVYLNRRVDAKLMALGQFAGRFIAKGEEGLGRFGALTGWKDKRARVTDVSQALRAATRQEYERVKGEQQRREGSSVGQGAIAQSSAVADHSAPGSGQCREGNEGTGANGASQSWGASLPSRTAFAGRAMEKGRAARESLRGFVGSTKAREHASKDGRE